jgi:hypothetical protein
MPFQRKAYNSAQVKDGLRRKVRDAMSAAAEAAADEMREVISSDMLTEASRARGGGRVKTGDMLNAVQSRKTRISDSGKSYQAFFGWSTESRRSHSKRIQGGKHFANGKEVKSYFDLQNWGFRLDPTIEPDGGGYRMRHRFVVGMGAGEAGLRKYKEVMAQEWRK